MRREQSVSPQAIDRTPDKPSTPGEGTSPGECPYVTGTVTRYCTLTPLTLTGAEQEAIASAAWEYEQSDRDDCAAEAATLRGLLERTRKVTE
jgi:hypothetical protein